MKLQKQGKTTGDSSECGKHKFMSLSILLILYITATQVWNFHDSALQYFHSGIRNTASATPAPIARLPRLGDGCYHIFLDVGANVGVHGRFLLEPHKYPHTRRAGELFHHEYALIDNRNVCVYAFEANARHWPRLDAISAAYAPLGWRYHVIHAAVSDQEGTTTFLHQGGKDEKHNEWGFSGFGNLGYDGAFEVLVPTIRLADWMHFHIHDRVVPAVIGDQDKMTPVVGMKMDIEGFEYVVLPDLIHSGALCPVDFAFGEFHAWVAPLRQFRQTIHNSTENSSSSSSNSNSNSNNNSNSSNNNTPEKNHRVSIETKQEADRYAHSLRQVMHASRNCDIRWDNIDDESYLHDGQPLPAPTAANTTMVGTGIRGR